MELTDPRLIELCSWLPAESWAKRVRAARDEAAGLDVLLERVRAGSSYTTAAREVCPDSHPSHTVARVRRYEKGGAQALIDRRRVRPKVKLTNEIKSAVRLLLKMYPEARTPKLCDAVESTMGVAIGESTMRDWLASEGLTHSVGRPSGSASGAVGVTPLPLAGAELLKAVEEEIGAIAALTTAMGPVLEGLPKAIGEVRDDRAHRDEHGHFLPSYNEPQERTDPGLGPKFASVSERREGKDLRAMRVVSNSFETRYRKDRTLTLLPIVVKGARWSELQHWRGQHLEHLVGVAYQPATLDKYARELKYAGVSSAVREGLASFWLEQEGAHVDSVTGGIVLYCDASTKPLWTRHYSKSTRVSKTGRVQPAVSTLFLHSGAGTPLIYEAHSGSISLPKRVVAMLKEWERVAGVGTARRLVVIDREAHATWLLKELDAAGWTFLVPLRRNCATPDRRWEDLGAWKPVHPEVPDGPQVRDAKLWLNDSKAPNEPLRVRAISRRTGEEDAGATWGTNAPELFSPADLLRLYSDRWSKQEHVFRDGNGRVGLARHHGYGKQRVDNIAIIDKREHLDAKGRRAQQAHDKAMTKLSIAEQARDVQSTAIERVQQRIDELNNGLDEEVSPGVTVTGKVRRDYDSVKSWQSWMPTARTKLQELQQHVDKLQERADKEKSRAETLTEEWEKLASKTEIYTVDTELDEIMTGYKLTFMNLCLRLMREFMDVRWQIDHLISAVLTLPGDRRRTADLETIRIYRQKRDPQAMAAVAHAIEAINKRELCRDGRRLLFRLVTGPGS